MMRFISILNVLFGMKQLISMYMLVVSVDVLSVVSGMLCLFIEYSIFGVLFCCVRLNSIWLLQYMLLLQIDSVVVSMMMFSMFVIRLLLSVWKISMNGLLLLMIFFYGYSDSSMVSVLMQKIRMWQMIWLVVCGMLCFGLLVLVVVMLISLSLLNENMIVVIDIMRFDMLFGKKLLCCYRFWMVVFGLVWLFVSSQLLKLIILMIVVILMIENQNFVLLYDFMLVRLIRLIVMKNMSVDIQVGMFGYQYCMQILMVDSLVMLMRMYSIQQFQLDRKFVKWLKYLFVKQLNDFVMGLLIIILLSWCMMKNVMMLVIVQLSSMDGLVILIVCVMLRNSFVLSVLLSVINWMCWFFSLCFRLLFLFLEIMFFLFCLFLFGVVWCVLVCWVLFCCVGGCLWSYWVGDCNFCVLVVDLCWCVGQFCC